MGWRVTARLAATHEVVAFDRCDPPAEFPAGATYIQGDLRDADKVRLAAAGAEAVVHLAAISGRMPWIPQSETFAINVQGTFHVLEAAARAKARNVVLASSLCAIGLPTALHDHGLSYLPIDEDHPCCPRHVYDLSKRLNEITAETFTRLTGVATLCIRFPALLDVQNSPWAMTEVHRDPPRLVLGDYLDFQDAVALVEAALARHDLKHDVFFAVAETLGIAQPTPEYVKRFEPRLEWRGDPPGDTTPIINCARMKSP